MKNPASSRTRIPRALFWGTLAVCVLPTVLGWFGVDLGVHVDGMVGDDSGRVLDGDRLLRGSYTQTLLQWTAFCTAFFAFVLAMVLYSLRRDAVSLMIGGLLLSAGALEAFHALAADNLVGVATDTDKVTPLTWTIGRLFDSLIIVGGAIILLLRGRDGERSGPGMILANGMFFWLVSVGGMYLSVSTASLPEAVFPDAIVKRPWDTAPLLLYCMGLYLAVAFRDRCAGLPAKTLMLSMAPAVALQLHLVFGSATVFDHHFNAAHSLKVVQYLVPLIGLATVFVATLKRETDIRQRLEQARHKLESRTAQLEAELASHSDTERRLRKHDVVLAELSKRESIAARELDVFLRLVTETAGKTLRVERTSVWAVDPAHGGMRCADRYELGADLHRSGDLVPGPVAGGLLEELERCRVVTVDDARTSFTTRDLAATPLLPDGFPGLVAASVRREGRLTGAVVFQRVGPASPWPTDVVEFATSVADLVSKVLEAWDRQKAEARTRAIVESAADGILSLDDRGTIQTANPAVERVFGYSPEELVGKSISHIVLYPLPDLVAAEMGRPAHSGHRREVTGQRRNGNTFPVEIAVNEFRLGDDTTVTCIVRDVTERKQFEQRILQQTAELKRSNRELEEFAYVASHDLQEPLRMVAGYTRLLQRRYEGQLDDNADEFIRFAVEGVERMHRLIQDLLDYSRIGRGGDLSHETALDEVFETVVTHLQPAIEESGAIVSVDPLPTVHADNAQMIQLFQNLVSNAIKFRGAEPPRIRVSATVDESGDCVISVADNGIGIDPRHEDRVFVIFQRLHTREEYPGTGIGLALVKKIVERHGGGIHFESEPGRGTVFHVRLPHRRVVPGVPPGTLEAASA